MAAKVVDIDLVLRTYMFHLLYPCQWKQRRVKKYKQVTYGANVEDARQVEAVPGAVVSSSLQCDQDSNYSTNVHVKFGRSKLL